MCGCFGDGLAHFATGRLSRRKMLSGLACFAVGTHVTAARAQPIFKNLQTGACNFYPSDVVPASVSSFGSTVEAQAVVSKIMNATGLKPNFEVISYNVPNAAAVIQNGIRYILYNPNFIAQITNATGSQWASWTIMAHEVGHHLNGHTLQAGGSKPPTELEADEFAGFSVQKIGGSLDQALSPYMTMGEAGSVTHPPRQARLDAVTNGWKAAAGTGGGANIPTTGTVPPPVANAQDMLKAVVTSIQSGQTPPFAMVPALKAAYDSQMPMLGPQIKALGSLTKLVEVKSPVSRPEGLYYEYRSEFSGGQAFWRIGVAPNGVITGLWVSPTPF